MNKLPFVNKKKVRGWKRQIKKLEKLIENSKELNSDFLSKYKYKTLELWISPWGNLVKRNPPIWYRKLYLKKLLDLYFIWEEQLKKNYKDYYLEIWLFHPNFYGTQLVAAVDDRIEYYEKLFNPVNDNKTTFPKEYKIPNIDSFHWIPFYEEDEAWKNADELDDDSIKWLEKNSYKVIQESGDTIYKIRKGYIWLNKKT